MTKDLGMRSSSARPKPEALAAAIGAYVEAMQGTGVDLDEDFEATALEGWTDLDDADDVPASRPRFSA